MIRFAKEQGAILYLNPCFSFFGNEGLVADKAMGLMQYFGREGVIVDPAQLKLIASGGNDVRDPRGESEQVAAAIKKNGGFVQIKIYENEGHQFSRIENQIDAYRRVSDFLKVRVPSPGCGCSIYE